MSQEAEPKCTSGKEFVYAVTGVVLTLIILISTWVWGLSTPQESAMRTQQDEMLYKFYRSQLLLDHTEYRDIVQGNWSNPVPVESYERFKTHVEPSVWLDTMPDNDPARIITETPTSLTPQDLKRWVSYQRNQGNQLQPNIVAHSLRFRINSRSNARKARVEIRFTVMK